MMRPTLALPAILLVAAASTACSRNQPDMAPPPVTMDDTSHVEAEPAAPGHHHSPAPGVDASAERERQMAEARRTLAAAIYFDFDRADLSPAARATLDAKLAILTANPGMRIRVSGHADERGSDEYNLALGQRRAAAAKRYLADRGVAAGRIETVSFGEERPATGGTSETAWSQNRRDEFEVTAGGEMVGLR